MDKKKKQIIRYIRVTHKLSKGDAELIYDAMPAWHKDWIISRIKAETSYAGDQT